MLRLGLVGATLLAAGWVGLLLVAGQQEQQTSEDTSGLSTPPGLLRAPSYVSREGGRRSRLGAWGDLAAGKRRGSSSRLIGSGAEAPGGS